MLIQLKLVISACCDKQHADAYLQPFPFRRSSFLECALQPKIANINKDCLFWKFRVFQSYPRKYDWKARH